MTLAPIVLTVHRRLEHTQRTVEALARNELAAASDLFVFSDGPRNAEQAHEVEQVRAFVRTIGGFRSVHAIARETSFGLARSVISAVQEVLHSHDRVIVVEDDLLTSPYFLRFMNEGLECYATTEAVASIHGYMYPVKEELPDTFFLRGADCWGWATWRRAWQHFEPDGRILRAELRRRALERDFDLRGARRLVQMLEQQISGKNDSWAIRWHASAFLAEMYTLYPGRSLVDNIGNDSSGTHCSTTDAFRVQPTDRKVPVTSQAVREHEGARTAVEKYFRSQRRLSRARVRAMVRRLSDSVRSPR